jgi:hypothetical protein
MPITNFPLLKQFLNDLGCGSNCFLNDITSSTECNELPQGVFRCSLDGNVAHLNLNAQSLSGTISLLLPKLSRLTMLDLSNNQLLRSTLPAPPPFIRRFLIRNSGVAGKLPFPLPESLTELDVRYDFDIIIIFFFKNNIHSLIVLIN